MDRGRQIQKGTQRSSHKLATARRSRTQTPRFNRNPTTNPRIVELRAENTKSQSAGGLCDSPTLGNIPILGSVSSCIPVFITLIIQAHALKRPRIVLKTSLACRPGCVDRDCRYALRAVLFSTAQPGKSVLVAGNLS